MIRLHLVNGIAAIFTVHAAASDFFGCNSTIQAANASGIETFHVDWPLADAFENTSAGQPIQYVPDPSWAYTVNERSGRVESTIWYDTAGQNYSDDMSLEYDVCAFILSDLPKNTIRLGQDDPGDCSSVLSSSCREEILDRMSASALKWTTYWSPSPYSNLSAGVLPAICSYILSDLGEDGKTYPRQCAQEFGQVYNINDPAYNNNINTNVVALTGYNDSVLNNDAPCNTLRGAGKTFQSLSPSISQGIDAYDANTRTVIPAMTVFFSVANYERLSFQTYALANMKCLRTKQFSDESRVSPQLPKGTPYHYGKSLGGGAIAGIVVGVVVFVLILAGAAFWFWRRRRRQLKASVTADEKQDGMNELNSDELYELKSEDRKVEKDSSPVHELQAEDGKLEKDGKPLHEIDGDDTAVELPGETKPT
jgi:hypothetical protein